MRVLLKISGEALGWGKWFGLDDDMLDSVANLILDFQSKKIELGIVVWAGNFIRWAEVEKIDRCNADNMGMLAININSIALADRLSKKWIVTKLVNSFWIDGVVERFNKDKAVKNIKAGKVIIFGWGTGNPYFTTDTAWVLRALEIEADMMIKATKVDGVYTKDPMKHKDAQFIHSATYDEVLTQNLKVMDLTAIALAKQNKLTIKVANLYKKLAILDAILWKKEGTTIS